MDFTNIDTPSILQSLDEKRVAMKLSYQNVANACNVSQATMIRIFKGETSPTLEMLQLIAAAVKFEEQEPPVVFNGGSTEDYIQYLKELIAAERRESQRKERQAEADRNRERNEHRQEKLCLYMIIIVFVVAACALFAYDFTHIDRGWFQMDELYHSSAVRDVLLSVRDWFNRTFV